jgi:hypothetical protein
LRKGENSFLIFEKNLKSYATVLGYYQGQPEAEFLLPFGRMGRVRQRNAGYGGRGDGSHASAGTYGHNSNSVRAMPSIAATCFRLCTNFQ